MREIFILLTVIMMACNAPEKPFLSENFNKDWEFVKDIDTTIKPVMFVKGNNDVSWEKVTLPHTANIEPLITTQKQWQGTCFYRKFFRLPARSKGKHIAIQFGAAMHKADVYLNSVLIFRHKGGYLPFYVDISDKVKGRSENCILVRLNNEDNPVIPPGKPIKELDFNYYSGLYRNVKLLIKDKLHLSDAVDVNRAAAGGILVSYENVSLNNADIKINTDVRNDDIRPWNTSVLFILKDSDGGMVTKLMTDTMIIAPSSHKIFSVRINLGNPKLWSPGNPYLYTLIMKILKNNQEVESDELRIGIRTFSMTAGDGLKINGNRVKLRGTNRHQEYPFIGYALSDNAQYRDALKIKQAGFNFVRCSHYPPSPAFLDACDELGIIVLNSTPGWQFFGNEEFQANSLQNIRDMIHRDRNHPCIMLWEASLNETGMSHDFMEKAQKIVHEELPFKDVYTCGWIDDVYDVFIPARQHAKPPDYWKKYKKDKPLIIAEYGDWEYYAQNAGLNQTEFTDLKIEERSSRQLRGYGQKRLAQQALNFQEAYNDNMGGNIVGDANWLMFDYNRGYSPDIEASGIMDIMRLPKFSYYFYQSQAGPDLSNGAEFGKPMIYIANFWSDSTFKTVTVYSNCEEAELYLNNQLISRQKPDKNRYSGNLIHPPFTFSLPYYKKGKLEAIGLIGGARIVTAQRLSPEKPSEILLTVDYSGKTLQSGCNDVVFVYASVTDGNGTIITGATDSIHFSIKGNGKLIGQNPAISEAGTAVILLKAGDKPGNIELHATSPGLIEKSITINVK